MQEITEIIDNSIPNDMEIPGIGSQTVPKPDRTFAIWNEKEHHVLVLMENNFGISVTTSQAKASIHHVAKEALDWVLLAWKIKRE